MGKKPPDTTTTAAVIIGDSGLQFAGLISGWAEVGQHYYKLSVAMSTHMYNMCICKNVFESHQYSDATRSVAHPNYNLVLLLMSSGNPEEKPAAQKTIFLCRAGVCESAYIEYNCA